MGLFGFLFGLFRFLFGLFRFLFGLFRFLFGLFRFCAVMGGPRFYSVSSWRVLGSILRRRGATA